MRSFVLTISGLLFCCLDASQGGYWRPQRVPQRSSRRMPPPPPPTNYWQPQEPVYEDEEGEFYEEPPYDDEYVEEEPGSQEEAFQNEDDYAATPFEEAEDAEQESDGEPEESGPAPQEESLKNERVSPAPAKVALSSNKEEKANKAPSNPAPAKVALSSNKEEKANKAPSNPAQSKAKPAHVKPKIQNKKAVPTKNVQPPKKRVPNKKQKNTPIKPVQEPRAKVTRLARSPKLNAVKPRKKTIKLCTPPVREEALPFNRRLNHWVLNGTENNYDHWFAKVGVKRLTADPGVFAHVFVPYQRFYADLSGYTQFLTNASDTFGDLRGSFKMGYEHKYVGVHVNAKASRYLHPKTQVDQRPFKVSLELHAPVFERDKIRFAVIAGGGFDYETVSVPDAEGDAYKSAGALFGMSICYKTPQVLAKAKGLANLDLWSKLGDADIKESSPYFKLEGLIKADLGEWAYLNTFLDIFGGKATAPLQRMSHLDVYNLAPGLPNSFMTATGSISHSVEVGFKWPQRNAFFKSSKFYLGGVWARVKENLNTEHSEQSFFAAPQVGWKFATTAALGGHVFVNIPFIQKEDMSFFFGFELNAVF